MWRTNCKRGGKGLSTDSQGFYLLALKETIKQRLWNIWKKEKNLHCIVTCRVNCKRGGEGLSADSHGFYILALCWNKQTHSSKYLEERNFFHCILMPKANCMKGGKGFSTDCHGSQLKQTIKLKKEKIFTVLWCAELTVREGGKDFLPILMDPEKQGEEPRKVYVTSRWPIHNLWGGATMLLLFVHQAQHSPCSPLSTKKSQKVHQSQ